MKYLPQITEFIAQRFVFLNKEEAIKKMKVLHLQAQKEIHEAELRAHPKGQQVIQVLNEVEDHAKNGNRSTPHITFFLTKDELWVLTESQRYKALQNLFQITHQIIEGEVEHTIQFAVPTKLLD